MEIKEEHRTLEEAIEEIRSTDMEEENKEEAHLIEVEGEGEEEEEIEETDNKMTLEDP